MTTAAYSSSTKNLLNDSLRKGSSAAGSAFACGRYFRYTQKAAAPASTAMTHACR